MKHFLVYTALRLGLFLGCWAALLALAALLFDSSDAAKIWSLVLAAVLSSVLSIRLLEGPRERFAASIQQRAARAAERVEEMRSAEDAD